MKIKRINLLPKQLRTSAKGDLLAPLKQLFQRSPLVGWAALAGGIILFFIFWQGSTVGRYRHMTTQLRKELKQIQTSNTKRKAEMQTLNVRRAELLGKREQLETLRQALIGARQPTVPISAILVELVKAIPEDVWMTKLSFNTGVLKIVGAARDTQSVSNMMSKLDSSKRFKKTTFAYTQRSPQDTVFMFEVSTTPILQEGNPL